MEKIKKSLHGIVDVSQAQLTARLAQIGKHLDAVDALLADAKGLTLKARRTTLRLRGEEELAALNGVLAFAASHEPMFVALANEDDGADSAKFETTLLADRLANSQALSALADRIEQLRSIVADSALYAVGLAKPAVLKAYEIAKPFRARDPQGDLLNAAVDFYGRGALAAVAAKKRNANGGAASTGEAGTEPAAPDEDAVTPPAQK
jgi:hypothetical protein